MTEVVRSKKDSGNHFNEGNRLRVGELVRSKKDSGNHFNEGNRMRVGWGLTIL